VNVAGLEASTRRALPRWPGWKRLPRDARDTLFLLAVIAWTVLPHASHLPAWSLALTLLVLLWRARPRARQRCVAGDAGCWSRC
jgi:Domain of unknown function (DUF3488).